MSLIAKKQPDFPVAHAVEVIRNGDLPRHETKSSDLSCRWGVQPNYLDQWLSSFGNDKRITLYRLVYQPGQLGFGFVNIDCLHDKPH
jgi:hypothetical protein